MSAVLRIGAALLVAALVIVGAVVTIGRLVPDQPTWCEQVAAQMVATHDYRPARGDKACFGQEDDPRVDAIIRP